MTDFNTERKCVGAGWQDILERLDADLQELAPGYGVMQIKEKFGGLRFYVALTATGGHPERYERVHQRIAAAEEEAWHTCENCGSKDDVTTGGVNGRFWTLTWCKVCRDARAEEPKP